MFFSPAGCGSPLDRFGCVMVARPVYSSDSRLRRAVKRLSCLLESNSGTGEQEDVGQRH